MVTTIWLFSPYDYIISNTCAEVKLLKIASSLHWNASPATVNQNDILVNLNLTNGVLNVVRNEIVSSSSIWFYPLLKSTTVNILAYDIYHQGF